MAVDSFSLRQAALRWGASLFGVADLDRLRTLPTHPANLLDGWSRAISLGVRLADPVLDDIVDGPTPLYAHHYQAVNTRLDDTALRLTLLIQESGGRALPLPASQTLDPVACTSMLSHKAVAVAAGLGWQGKSLLTISPLYGPRIRLCTVLTDLPLQPGRPLMNRCGNCTRCADACPAGAIKGAALPHEPGAHYESRDEALHFERCRTLLREDFARRPLIGHSVCGVCVKVCPWGARGKGVLHGRDDVPMTMMDDQFTLFPQSS